MKEMQCHDWLTDFLERRGFAVTRNYLLDTAFKAEFCPPCGAEGGPCIALLCEYDALPDIGHACGHNLIAEASVGAALAVKEAMETVGNIHGKLVVLGTPAEESLCGKEVLIQKGALQGSTQRSCATHLQWISWRPPSQRCNRGKAAHAGASPWEGLNALDAAVASYVNVGLLRQQMKTTARVTVRKARYLGKSVAGVITEGGGSPNVIPEEAEMSYNVRAPSTAELAELTRRVEACFHAAAEATGCTAHIDTPALYMHMIHNSAMARTYRKHSHALGVTFLDDVGNNLALSGASTDCGNVSHRVPTIHPVFAIGSAQGPANHTRGFADVANAAESQPPTLRAAKALALTVLDLLMDAELMREVQREFVALQLPSNEKIASHNIFE
ncbi:hypothetical protein HPB50_009710 [Hyalomma asiaticum]|uniref:Uncharacterized protein n=1 Tax=Hyalomma asiaticum TaxID=266040 RepID=A0ACB7RTB6_HYAAI|nr:hypothetical protein HPB50_009710 [Hyalomma asiaticum]